MIDRLQVGCTSKVHTLQPVFYLPCPAGPILQYGSRRSNPYLGGIETPICHMADGGFGVAEAVLICGSLYLLAVLYDLYPEYLNEENA